MSNLSDDRGLQPARTALSWRRTLASAVAVSVYVWVMAARIDARAALFITVVPVTGAVCFLAVERQAARLRTSPGQLSPWPAMCVLAGMISSGSLACAAIVLSS